MRLLVTVPTVDLLARDAALMTGRQMSLINTAFYRILVKQERLKTRVFMFSLKTANKVNSFKSHTMQVKGIASLLRPQTTKHTVQKFFAEFVPF
jgi:hypothetical protein